MGAHAAVQRSVCAVSWCPRPRRQWGSRRPTAGKPRTGALTTALPECKIVDLATLSLPSTVRSHVDRRTALRTCHRLELSGHPAVDLLRAGRCCHRQPKILISYPSSQEPCCKGHNCYGLQTRWCVGRVRPLARHQSQQQRDLAWIDICDLCLELQGTSQSGELLHWAETCAQKASELVQAAGAEATETVVGVLLAASNGWPRWVPVACCSEPGRPSSQQLALVDALSRRLGFTAMLHSSPVRYEMESPVYVWS